MNEKIYGIIAKVINGKIYHIIYMNIVLENEKIDRECKYIQF
jgi:hypothetical protein